MSGGVILPALTPTERSRLDAAISSRSTLTSGQVDTSVANGMRAGKRQKESSAPGQKTLPNEASWISQNGGPAAWGSWTQIVASTPAALYLTGAIWQPSSTQEAGGIFRVGKGGAGSEVEIVRWPYMSVSSHPNAVYTPFVYPVPVAASVRLALGMFAQDGTAIAFRVVLTYIPQSEVENF